MSGWIKLHRSMMEWGWYKNDTVKSVYLHILLSANHKDNEWEGITIHSGQVVTSTLKLSDELNKSRQQIRTALSKLEKTGEITIQSTNRYTLITVVKWADYQDTDSDSNQQNNHQITNDQPTDNQQITNKQPTNNHQITTNKNDKNEKNEKKVRNIFVAPSLEEVADYIQEKGYSISPEQFLNYYTSNGWMVGKTKMKDWKSAIRYWQSKQKPQTTTKGELPF